MKKSLNFAVFTLILMLFVLPSVFPNPAKNNVNSTIDNLSEINIDYIDMVNQSEPKENNIIEDSLDDEDIDNVEEIKTNDLSFNDLDTKVKKKYDEEVRKFKEGKVKNTSTPMLNNISNFSYNMQYIVSIVVSFSILGYMIFKCRKTKNN